MPVNWWYGPPPQPGDGLQTSTGRKYLILKVRAAGSKMKLDCLVLPKSETVPGTMFGWEWSPRRRKGR